MTLFAATCPSLLVNGKRARSTARLAIVTIALRAALGGVDLFAVYEAVATEALSSVFRARHGHPDLAAMVCAVASGNLLAPPLGVSA